MLQCLVVLALVIVHQPDVVVANGHIRMLRPQFFEINRQCFLVMLQCLVVLALLIVHRPDVVVAGGHIRMLRPQLLEQYL